jgi:hypothetical protein
MLKSTITNNTYRNILFAFLALSVILQLLAVLNGDFSFIPLVSMLANIVVLMYFFKNDEHLKLSVQVAAALTLVNSIVSLFFKGNFIELLATGSFFMLLLSLFFHFAPGLYLLVGSRKHIQTHAIDEWDPEQADPVNSNFKGILNRTTFNLLIIPFALAFNFWPMTHYSDGGCDGGTCTILILFHGAPLAVATILTIIAVNKALGHKGSYFVYAILAFIVNLAILIPDYGYRMDALKYPGYVIIAALVLSFVLYSNADDYTTEVEEPDGNTEKGPIIGWRERDEDKPND